MTTRTAAEQAAYFASAPADDDLDDLRDLLRLCARQTKDYFSAQDLTPLLYDKPRDVLENWGYKVLVDGKLKRMTLRGWLNNSGFGFYALTRAGRALVEEKGMPPRTPDEIAQAINDEAARQEATSDPTTAETPRAWKVYPALGLKPGRPWEIYMPHREQLAQEAIHRLLDSRTPPEKQQQIMASLKPSEQEQAMRIIRQTANQCGLSELANEPTLVSAVRMLCALFEQRSAMITELRDQLERAWAAHRQVTREAAQEVQRMRYELTHAQSGAD